MIVGDTNLLKTCHSILLKGSYYFFQFDISNSIIVYDGSFFDFNFFLNFFFKLFCLIFKKAKILEITMIRIFYLKKYFLLLLEFIASKGYIKTHIMYQ